MKIEQSMVDTDLPKDFKMKLIEQKHTVNLYKVDYTYKTKRGNTIGNYAYITAVDSTDARFRFMDSINDNNIKKPFRAISNVDILDVAEIGTVTL